MKKILLLALLLSSIAGFSQSDLSIPYSVRVKVNRPTDAWFYNKSFVRYTSTAQVLSEVGPLVRYDLQRFNVNGIEYVFKGGLADANLQVYIPGIPDQTGHSGQFLTTDGTNLSWIATSSGILNTALNNEIPKSNGTNIVSSGIFSNAAGNQTLGNSATTGTARVISTDGTGANIDLILNPKGTGRIFGVTAGNVKFTAQGYINLQSANNSDASINIDGIGSSSAIVLTASNVNTIADDMTITYSGGSPPSSNSVTYKGYVQGAKTYTAKQTFLTTTTTAGSNLGAFAGDPSTLVNGDIWYNSSIPSIRARVGGSTVSLGAGGSSYTVTPPITLTGSAIGIANAQADASTKGAATFTPNDFNDNGSGTISLDYTNAQKATTSLPGLLSAADFTTFNNKVSSSDVIDIAHGGTNATTANAGLNNLLPTQTTHGGQVLTTDGGNTAWSSVSGLAPTSFYGSPFAYGDSFSQGFQSTAGFGYINQLETGNSVAFSNNSLSGSGARYAAITAYSTQPRYLNVQPVTILVGFNDARAGGSSSGTVNKIVDCQKSIIVNSWLNFAVPASGMTASGTWTSYTSLSGKAGSALSGTSMQSSTVSNTLTYVTTVATTNIVIGTYNTDGTTYNYGRFTVTIDGVSQGTFDPNGRTDGITDGPGNDNKRTPNVLVYDNLSAVTHTVVITLLDAKTTVIDFIGYMAAPEQCPPIFVGSVPRMDATGYAIGAASDAVMTTISAAIKAMTDTFSKRPIFYINLDNFYVIATGLGADHIHPNDVGYTQIFQGFQSVIKGGGTLYDKITFTPQFNDNPAYAAALSSGSGTSFTMSSNRDPNTGYIPSSARSVAQYTIGTSNLDGSHNWYTSNVNGATPNLTMKLDKDGMLNIIEPSNTMKGYIRTTSDYIDLWANRNPLTGGYFDTGRGSSGQLLSSEVGGGNIYWYTSSGNNTSPVINMKLSSAGGLNVTNLTGTGTRMVVSDASGNLSTQALSPVISVKVPVSSAEILALGATPKTLIAAPGAGKIIDVISVEFESVYNTTVYTGGYNSMRISYNSTGADLNTVAFSIGNGAFTTYGKVHLDYQSLFNASVRVNTPLVLYAGSAPTTGDGTLNVHITYRITTL